MTTAVIDEPLICSIVCSYFKPYDLQQLQTVSRSFYEAAQMTLRDCIIVSACGLYTHDSHYYLPYLDIPLTDRCKITDSYVPGCLYLGDSIQLDDVEQEICIAPIEASLIAFKDQPMFLYNRSLYRDPKYPSCNELSKMGGYCYGLGWLDEYDSFKQRIINDPNDMNAVLLFLDIRLHKHERDNIYPLKTQLFTYATFAKKYKLGRYETFFEEIFEKTGFCIERHEKTYKVFHKDRKTIQEFIDFIKLIDTYGYVRHGYLYWPEIYQIDILDDSGICIHCDPRYCH